MQEYMPYIVSIVCAIISGVSSVVIVRKQTKNDINKIMKQHEVDLMALERKHQMEIEKLNIEHSHQLELQAKEFEAKLGSSIITEAMRLPEVRQQISEGMKKGKTKRK